MWMRPRSGAVVALAEADEARQAREGEVDLGGHAPALGSCAGAARRRDRAAVGSSRARNVCCGSRAETTARGRDLLAAGQDDARHPAVLDEDALHPRAGAHLRAQRAAASARAAARAPSPPFTCTAEPAPLPPAWRGLQQELAVVPADQGPASRPADPARRPGRRAAARSRTTRPRSRPRPWAPSAAGAGASLRPRPRKPRPRPRRGNTSAMRGSSRSGGVMASDLASTPLIAREAGGELRVAPWRPAADRRAISTAVLAGSPQSAAPAVGQRREEPRLRLQELEAAGQAQVAGQGGAEGARRVGHRRGPEAGVELLGHRRRRPRWRARSSTSGFRPALASSAAAVRPLTAAADHDDVGPHATLPRLQSFRISRAARRPGAPMMPPPGMGGGAAHVEVLHRRAVAGPARHGPQEEELLEGQLALEDVALGEAPLALQVQRRQHLAVQDELLQVGRVLGDGVHHRVAEGLALLVPGALAAACRARTARSRTGRACPAGPPKDR